MGKVHCQRSGSEPALSPEEQRVDLDVPAVVGAAVEAGEQRALAAGEKDVGIARIGRDIAALAAAHAVRVGGAASSASSAGAAGSADGGAVLLRAADMVRDLLGDGHVVELRGGVLLAGPRLAAVEGDVAAAVIALDHAQGVGGVDPEVVIIGV